MILRPPIHPALRGLVRLVWHVAAPRTGRETVLPAGVAQLLVNRASDRLSWWTDSAHSTGGAALSGPFGRLSRTLEHVDAEELTRRTADAM